MKNVQMELKGNQLVITVDIEKRLGKSSSGKNMIIATTEGNADVPGAEGVKIGLNVYIKE